MKESINKVALLPNHAICVKLVPGMYKTFFIKQSSLTLNL